MTTLRRELVQKFREIIRDWEKGGKVFSDSGDSEIWDVLADAALELRAFQMFMDKPVDISWVAAGLPVTEEQMEKETDWKETEVLYERLMGYNPLDWHNNPKLKKLLDFLITKPEHEIKAFAAWSKAPFSPLSPPKARADPQAVIDNWPYATGSDTVSKPTGPTEFEKALRARGE